ncbi:hypothetical protein O59_003748 [Cellvibrio sp. BR]|jgi:hypothetical protein|nr:hypothetical protein O59_003748 [Cellvibrio sp. BR]
MTKKGLETAYFLINYYLPPQVHDASIQQLNPAARVKT